MTDIPLALAPTPQGSDSQQRSGELRRNGRSEETVVNRPQSDDLTNDSATFALSFQTILQTTTQTFSRSLDIHGAAPQATSLDAAPARDATQQNQTHSQPNTRQSETAGSVRSPEAPIIEARTGGSSLQTSSGAQSSSQISLQPLTTTSPLVTVLPATVQATIQASAAQTVATASAQQSNAIARDGQTVPLASLATRSSATTTRYTSTPTPPAQPLTFQHILAQRLGNGDTRFEVRLDPPELGRIHVELTAGDTDKTRINLTFEHAQTLNRFRDQQDELRSLLADILPDQDHLTLDFALDTETHHNDNRPPLSEQFMNLSVIDTSLTSETPSQLPAPLAPSGMMHRLNIEV